MAVQKNPGALFFRQLFLRFSASQTVIALRRFQSYLPLCCPPNQILEASILVQSSRNLAHWTSLDLHFRKRLSCSETMFAPVLLSKAELQSPPSCSHGLLMTEEIELRRRYELFIRTAGLLLRLYPRHLPQPLLHLISPLFFALLICLPPYTLIFSLTYLFASYI